MDETEEHGCCGKTSTKICVWKIVFGFLISVTGLCIFIAFLMDEPDNICTSVQCIKAAAEIVEVVDRSADPCTNLDDWSATNCPINSEIQRPNLEDYITGPQTPEDLPVVTMQKKFFSACMDVDAMDRNNDHAFLDIIKELGGWPILERDRWKAINFNWLNMMKKAVKLGVPFEWFLTLQVIEDNHLKLGHPKNVRPMQSQEYMDFMIQITANMLGVLKNINEAMLAELINVVNFSKYLQVILITRSNDAIVASTSELSSMPPFIPYRQFLQSITRRKWYDNTPIYIESNMRNYIFKLDGLLNSTPTRTWANFIMLKIAEYFAPFLSKNIREAYENYTRQANGEEFSRLQFCMDDARSKFPYVSEYAFIRNQAKEEERSKVSEMSNILIETAGELFPNYINESNIQIDIGAQEECFGEDFEKRYLYLDDSGFDSDNIIDIITARNRMYTSYKFDLIGTQRKNRIFFQDNIASDISAFPEENRIIVPATLLQSTVYHTELPNYLNYANLGCKIGSKLASFLDETDKETILQNLTPNCFNTSQNGNVTDKIFDNFIGIEICHRAYEKWSSEEVAEETLPGLDFTNKQIFWMRIAMNLCEQDHDYYRLDRIENFRRDFTCSDITNQCDDL